MYSERALYFLYCIHYLTTIILIGKRFIYTNKLSLITGIFRWSENNGPLTVEFVLNASENGHVKRMPLDTARTNQAPENESDVALLFLPCK